MSSFPGYESLILAACSKGGIEGELMKEIPVEEAGGPAVLGLRFLSAALLADAALLPSRNTPSRSSSTVSVSTTQQSQWLLSEVSTPVSQYHIRSEITWLLSLHDANLLLATPEAALLFCRLLCN